MPDAWVFPGGRLDEGDALPPQCVSGEIVVPGLDRTLAQAHAVAGVRETFEESGIWIGEEELSQEARSDLAMHPTGFERWMRSHKLRVNLALLRPWTRWVTPDSEPRRYDTVFFVGHFDAAWAGPVHDEQETVDSGWYRPVDVISRKIRDFPVAPPTWWVLVELSRFKTVAEVMQAGERHCLPVQPVLAFSERGMDVVLPGHRLHPHGPMEGHPTSIEMRDGAWVVGT